MKKKYNMLLWWAAGGSAVGAGFPGILRVQSGNKHLMPFGVDFLDRSPQY